MFSSTGDLRRRSWEILDRIGSDGDMIVVPDRWSREVGRGDRGGAPEESATPREGGDGDSSVPLRFGSGDQRADPADSIALIEIYTIETVIPVSRPNSKTFQGIQVEERIELRGVSGRSIYHARRVSRHARVRWVFG
ncbi:uncharacterized protein LOC131150555 [Malania oleifera]|uniref:uncharacterized protein LOC131150555 n=1 Tax=Malania oleifera TaxID=397392 RepID=UPI0025AEA13D|nr:uncharacterized protein LOC131150555 [Malania oleifera]